MLHVYARPPGGRALKQRALRPVALGKALRPRLRPCTTGPQGVYVDRTAVIAGDRPSGTKDAVQAMLDEQASSSNSAAGRASNGAASSLANVTITGDAAARARNGNGNGNGNGAATSNGNGAAAAAHLEMDSCDAGHLEACAATRIAEQDRLRGKADASTSSQAASSSSGGVGGSSSDMDTPYKAAGFSAWRRTIQIYAFAIAFAFKYWRLGKKGTYKGMAGGMSPENVSAKKTELAKWLKAGLIKLGPTFIKIGQQFSTRVDVLSPEFIKELEELQDNVPAFGAGAVRATIERSFRRPVEDLFEEFDFEPIAAASLGQVHLAKLNGKRVVVKVQRPGLKELFDVDLKNVRVIAQWLQRLDPKSDGAARDWVAIYDECSRILYEEINYLKEAEYARDFAANFAGTPWIKVPEINRDYLSPEVIVMEYVPGVKINNAAAIDEMGLDRSRLATLAVESYLQQLLRYGLFHADPHPGNVAVDAENGGRLIYYDFGMMGRIQPRVRTGLREFFYGVYQKDADKCLDALEAMGVLVGGDRTSVKRTAQFFIESFDARLAAQRAERLADPESQNSFKGARSKEDSKAKRKEILSNIGEDLLLAAADKPFRFPAEFTFVVRSFTVLDGIGKSLSPRFDITEISRPYARELIFDGKSAAQQVSDRVAKGLRKQDQAVKGLFTGPIKIDEIQEGLRRIENGDTKPRVRALEVERALQRMAVQQALTLSIVLASMFVNIGTVLSVSALPLASSLAFGAAAVCTVLTLVNWLKGRSLAKKEAQLAGAV